MTLDEILKHFGSKTKTAHHLQVSRQALYVWKKQGYIPYSRQLMIEALTDGALKASPDYLYKIKGKGKND